MKNNRNKAKNCRKIAKKRLKSVSEPPILNIWKSNHMIGCELEGYTDVLYYRGLNDLAKQLEEIASRLK